MDDLQHQLIAKYDVASPRYTSYPTVPYWSDSPTQAQWLQRLRDALRRQAGADSGTGAANACSGLGLYVHLPFCRALCTYCGCNTRISRTHTIVPPYIDAVLHEYRLYREHLGLARPPVGELHLGGGTPTFLDCDELEQLLEGLLGHSTVAPDAELSVEVDPRVTTAEQLALLARHGFRRISLGVQDFDPRVQKVVNRMQSEQQVRTVSEHARALGFDSANFDLIYGLPLQTLASIEQTTDAVVRLRPDRIALYGYAHVPWMRPGQRGFDEGDLPVGAARRALYEQSRERLEGEGYREIGLDHFALETDSLWQTAVAGRMHRNFMGYTSAHTEPLLGLGVSAIGDAGDAFAQNEKDFTIYQQRLARDELPIQRGHLLDDEDRVLRRHIHNLMTRLATDWSALADNTSSLQDVQVRLAEFERDGLLQVAGSSCRVTALGRGFLRNICMAFDARLARQQPDKPLFSRSA